VIVVSMLNAGLVPRGLNSVHRLKTGRPTWRPGIGAQEEIP